MKVERIGIGQDVFQITSYKTVLDESEKPVSVPDKILKTTRDRAIQEKTSAEQDVVFWDAVIAAIDVIIATGQVTELPEKE